MKTAKPHKLSGPMKRRLAALQADIAAAVTRVMSTDPACSGGGPITAECLDAVRAAIGALSPRATDNCGDVEK